MRELGEDMASQSQPCADGSQEPVLTSGAEPSALADLLAELEGASGPRYLLDAQIDHLIGKSGLVIPPAYTASLDKALALVERVLPGAWVELSGPRKYLNIPTPVPNYWRAECGSVGWGATSALALLAAMLRALADAAPQARTETGVSDKGPGKP